MNTSVKIMKDNINSLKCASDTIPVQVNYQNSPVSHSKLVRSRAGTPNLVPDSPRSLDGYVTKSTTHLSATSSPARRIMVGHLSSSAYDSDDSVRLDRTSQTAMKQDIISLKTMLLKLRRVLNEAETHSPFDGQTGLCNLINGISNGSSSCCVPPECDGSLMNDNDVMARQELLELRRQVLFLQGQLEDKEKTVRNLREQMIKMAVDTDRTNSAPAAILSSQMEDGQVSCNAATQTERIRPISAGPSLLNGSSVESSAGSLVSAISTSPLHLEQRNPSNVCRRMVKPSSSRRPTVASSIPRRANSNTRISASTTTT